MCEIVRTVLGELDCPQEAAYSLVIAETHLKLIQDFHLVSGIYDGDKFVFFGRSYSDVVKALCALSESIPQTVDEHTSNTGKARDLREVLMSEDIEYLGDKECIFCGDWIKNGQMIRRTQCLHIFHSECLDPWLKLKQVCPIDKMPI